MKRSVFNLLLLPFLFGLFFTPVAGLRAEEHAGFEAERAKVLSFIIRQHLSRFHFNRKAFDDDLSKAAFSLFLEQVDSQKRFLLVPDVQQLKVYETLIDDEMVLGQIDLPVITARLMKQRVEKVEKMVDRLLAGGFDFHAEDRFETDPKKRSFCATEGELEERWRKMLKYQIILSYLNLAEEQQEKPTRDEVLWKTATDRTRKSFHSLFSRLRRQDQRTYYSLYLNAVARSFDPHTQYLDPNTEEDFDISMKGSLEGIGASLREDDGAIKVVDIIPGSAAARQGQLSKEDVILKVGQGDGEAVDVSEMRLRDAVKLIRGKKGSEVRLTVQKPNGDILMIPIVRDLVNIEETFIKTAVLTGRGNPPQRVGYIDVPSFYRDLSSPGGGEDEGRNASEDFRAALEQLKAQDVQGVIVDLRDDGGGALQDAVNIAGDFIDQGPVVQIKDSQGRMKTLFDPQESVVFAGPVVVLVNKFSASASEILAAALQDYGRAIIVGGEHTHGKGTVQALIDLDQGYYSRKMDRYGPLGALKVTIQKFYRINGDSTQYRGVIPDIVLPDLLAPLESGERYMSYSLPWDRVTAVAYERWPVKRIDLDALRRKSLEEVDKNPAFARIREEIELERNKISHTLRPLSLAKLRQEHNEIDKLRNGEEILFDDFSVEEANPAAAGTEEGEKNLSRQLVRDPYVWEAFRILRRVTQN
jgi:carboxyl-terminal processing protease